MGRKTSEGGSSFASTVGKMFKSKPKLLSFPIWNCFLICTHKIVLLLQLAENTIETNLLQNTSRILLVKIKTPLFFLGCNQDNNHGYNFITKKKICLVHQKRKLGTIEINKCLLGLLKFLHSFMLGQIFMVI